ncbi:putative mitochondrial protein [Glycine soja]
MNRGPIESFFMELLVQMFTTSGLPYSESIPVANPAPVNTHPRQTRSKSGIHNSRLHPSLFLVHSEPKTVKQALENSDWFSAMQQEYDALPKNKTWEEECRSANTVSVTCSVLDILIRGQLYKEQFQEAEGPLAPKASENWSFLFGILQTVSSEQQVD